MAHPLVRPRDVRAVLAAAAARQARRELARRERRVHLGDDPAALRGAAQRAEEGDVRLRARRLRARARTLRDGARASEGVEIRCSATRRAGRARPATGCRSGSTGAGAETFDHVVVTSDAPTADRLCPDLTEAERARLRGHRVPGHRVRVAGAALVAGAVLPHLPHGRPPVHRGRGDDRARRPEPARWSRARVPAEVRRARRPAVRRARRRDRGAVPRRACSGCTRSLDRADVLGRADLPGAPGVPDPDARLLAPGAVDGDERARAAPRELGADRERHAQRERDRRARRARAPGRSAGRGASSYRSRDDLESRAHESCSGDANRSRACRSTPTTSGRT